MVPSLLIVEDNEDDLFLLKKALERAHVTNAVHSVSSGAEMTKYLMGLGTYRDRTAYPLPGLIFLDLKLSDMRGTDVLRFLNGQKDLHAITVIVWSAAVSARDAAEAKDLDIKCCVLKPNTSELLNQTIRGLNDYLAVEGLPPALHFE